MSLDDSQLREVFENIIDEEYWRKLSKWEKSFIEETKDRWERTGFLHPGTIVKIEEIKEKAGL